jgi:hypothetical protein
VSGVLAGSAGTTSIDGNDTISGTETTFNNGDVINGGGGTDVFNLSLASAPSGTVTVVGVETINVSANNFFATSLSATGIITTGVTLNLTNAAAGGSFTVTGLATGATVNAAGVSGALSLSTAAATSQTVTLLANTAASQTVTLTGSGVADVATLTAAGTVALTVSAVETVNLSGNGAAATYTVTGTAGQTFNLTGSQNVTVSGTAATLAGDTLTDNTTAGTTTLKVVTTSGTADVSKTGADLFEINADAGGHKYTVKPSQAVKISTANTVAAITLDINDQTTANVTGSISVDLGAAILGTADLGIITDATASSDNITALTLTNNTADQSFTLWAGTASHTTGSAVDVTVSGTKALTLGANSTAKSVTATGLSGVLTVNYDNTANIATVTGGSGNDFFTNGSAAIGTQVTINGGAGNDTFTMLTAAKAVIDGGAGFADTVKLVTATANDATNLTLSNVEVIAFENGGANAVTFKASQLSGKTYVITGDATADKIVVGGATGLIDSTTIDLSQLVLDTTNITSTEVTMSSVGYIASTIALGATLNITGTNVSDTINVSSMSGGASIIGGAGTDNITGGAGADTILGGAGSDTITGGAGLDALDLGASDGAVDIIITTGSITAANVDTVANFVGGSDVVQVDRSEVAALATGTIGLLQGTVKASALAGTLAVSAATVLTITAASTPTAASLIVADTATAYTATTLARALEVGGGLALTTNGAVAAADGFLIAYDDNANTYLALVSSTAGASSTTFAANDLTVTNFLTITGMASATSFTTADFQLIA